MIGKSIRSLDYTQINQTVTVRGWIQSVRRQKTVHFLILRDHEGLLLQLVHGLGADPDPVAEVTGTVTPESAVVVTGKLVGNPRVKLDQRELQIEEIEVVGPAEAPLPIDEKTSLDSRLDWRFLDLRRPESRLVIELQTMVEEAMRTFWIREGFLEIHSPKLIGAASESGAELFKLGYFGREAYLAQSPQFYKQMAMAAGLDRIFEIGPVFRANPSFTSRHDTEFTSVDVEISWIESHEDVMALEERWLEFVLRMVASWIGDKVRKVYSGREIKIPTLPFPRITLEEARRILIAQGHQFADDNPDLDPQGERSLSEWIARNYSGHQFVFVTDYPASARAFYHMRYPDRPDTTKSFDLLWNGLEVTTGAQREHRYPILRQQAEEKGISPDEIQFYLDFFRYGMPPHGGYGFGLTRMLMILLGLGNVREVTYLYRGPNRLTP